MIRKALNAAVRFIFFLKYPAFAAVLFRFACTDDASVDMFTRICLTMTALILGMWIMLDLSFLDNKK